MGGPWIVAKADKIVKSRRIIMENTTFVWNEYNIAGILGAIKNYPSRHFFQK